MGSDGCILQAPRGPACTAVWVVPADPSMPAHDFPNELPLATTIAAAFFAFPHRHTATHLPAQPCTAPNVHPPLPPSLPPSNSSHPPSLYPSRPSTYQTTAHTPGPTQVDEQGLSGRAYVDLTFADNESRRVQTAEMSVEDIARLIEQKAGEMEMRTVMKEVGYDPWAQANRLPSRR